MLLNQYTTSVECYIETWLGLSGGDVSKHATIYESHPKIHLNLFRFYHCRNLTTSCGWNSGHKTDQQNSRRYIMT